MKRFLLLFHLFIFYSKQPIAIMDYTNLYIRV